MTKIDGRTKKEAAKQLDKSLERMQTDHIDLVQHHEIFASKILIASSTIRARTLRCSKPATPVRSVSSVSPVTKIRTFISHAEVAKENGFSLTRCRCHST